MKEKVITLFMATSMIACITACGKRNQESTQATTGSENTTILSTEETPDASADNTTDTEDTTIFDTEESCITLREYLDSHVAIFQNGENIGAQNGDVFKERGYDNSYNIVYELCGTYYGGADVIFTDSHDNTIVIDFMADGYDINLDLVNLHMHEDFIDSISYEGNPVFYTFSYDEAGNLIQYSDGYLNYCKENSSSSGTCTIAYPKDDIPENYIRRWKFKENGDISSIVYIEGCGMIYNFEQYIGDDSFYYVKSISINDCIEDTTEVIEY